MPATAYVALDLFQRGKESLDAHCDISPTRTRKSRGTACPFATVTRSGSVFSAPPGGLFPLTQSALNPCHAFAAMCSTACAIVQPIDSASDNANANAVSVFAARLAFLTLSQSRAWFSATPLSVSQRIALNATDTVFKFSFATSSDVCVHISVSVSVSVTGRSVCGCFSSAFSCIQLCASVFCCTYIYGGCGNLLFPARGLLSHFCNCK